MQASIQEKETYRKELILAKEKVMRVLEKYQCSCTFTFAMN